MVGTVVVCCFGGVIFGGVDLFMVCGAFWFRGCIVGGFEVDCGWFCCGLRGAADLVVLALFGSLWLVCWFAGCWCCYLWISWFGCSADIVVLRVW